MKSRLIIIAVLIGAIAAAVSTNTLAASATHKSVGAGTVVSDYKLKKNKADPVSDVDPAGLAGLEEATVLYGEQQPGAQGDGAIVPDEQPVGENLVSGPEVAPETALDSDFAPEPSSGKTDNRLDADEEPAEDALTGSATLS